MQFPHFRARRTRRTPAIRRMVRQTNLEPADLLYPIFVVEGKGVCDPIAAMPGQFRYSVDQLKPIVRGAVECGVPGLLLFGIPKAKDPLARGATAKQGVIPTALRAIKDIAPDLVAMTDVCVCAYTDHGHCGVLRDGDVDNDASLELIGEMALVHAQAGADFVAPSDMMDGRVGFIRETLDEADLENVGILAYSAKYASAFYGPFRDAAHSAPQQGDRATYQMDPANAREALLEVTLDIEEGADMVMVKPALAYLDVIRQIRDEVDLPVAAYNVSGEYSLVKVGAAERLIDEERLMMEILTAIKRAGADIVITYHALEAARILS